MNNKQSRDEKITKKIIDEIYDIELFVANMSEEEYYSDKKTQKAVVMSLINIGELVKAYTEEFLVKHSYIPWKKIQALRNIAAHKYEAIDPTIVWDTIKISVPDLKQAFEKDK